MSSGSIGPSPPEVSGLPSPSDESKVVSGRAPLLPSRAATTSAVLGEPDAATAAAGSVSSGSSPAVPLVHAASSTAAATAPTTKFTRQDDPIEPEARRFSGASASGCVAGRVVALSSRSCSRRSRAARATASLRATPVSPIAAHPLDLIGCAPVQPRALVGEFIGTAFLLAGVVGSGIMAERLSTDVGVVLLANAAATAGVLLVIIYMFGPVSGAHFNPVVTLAEAALGDRRWAEVVPYIVIQVAGGAFGTILANLMFDLDAVNVSTKARTGSHLWLAEIVATYGLVLVIFLLVRSGRTKLVAGAVASYIGAAYWFTASTSFANPAVTVARTLSDTFAGIEPASAPMFVAMQLAGAALAALTVRLLYPPART
ncbi:MAG: aquaporin family protein [Acidimicrobiia bacterium]|nr:aquaporin family protein [Acidimicrobiia bacterium]